MSKTRSLLLLLICCSLLARPVAASTVRYQTDAQLIQSSERVVHALVVSQRTTWDGPQHKRIYTVTTLSVIEDFTGQPGQTIEVWELGGQVGDDVMYVGGAVEYKVGGEVVVCLERGPSGLRSVAMNLSRWDVLANGLGGATLQRDLHDTSIVGGVAAAQDRSLESFRQLAASVTGRSSLKYQQPVGASLPRVEDNFTKLGGEPGIRWKEADLGTAIRYYRNTANVSPLQNGSDSTAEIQTALVAWTAPASASISLTFSGTTNEADPDGPWTSITGAVGLISYEDPNNEISGSTLAIGGGFGTLSTGGTLNGVTFNGFTRAYVIFQNAANLSAGFRETQDFTRVLTHEVGHTIGLGHTQEDGSVASAMSNIMLATCCHTETPVSPAIGLDDTAGVASFYPATHTDGCTYTLNPQSATAPTGGGASSATLTTQAGCAWSVVSNSSFVTLNSASSGTGSAAIQYSVAANSSTNTRLGSLTASGQTLTITQAAAAGPTMALDKSVLYFGATLSGTTVTFQTSSQVVRMTQANAGTVTWTATPSQPWIQVTPTSGTGSTDFSISVAPAGLALGSFTGSVSITLSGTTSTVGPISVGLTTIAHGTSANPVGTVDTPINNATGIIGALPFTGWAIDDIEVTRTTLCRAAFGAESAPVDGNCAGAAQIYVGDAVFIDGARPDVQATFPGVPRNSRAGWGFMVLTNMLPAQGNGTYTFYMYAFDREGHNILLGARTITVDNANATKPFGFIDTPVQGGVASASNYVNFGWVLTQQPKIVPIDGSTIFVLVDGASLGNADYNHYRPDIANTFPGLRNSDGAIGFRILDTTAMLNGLHTISWTVTDSGGNIEGIGSRYFSVSNGVGAVTAADDLALSPHAASDNGQAAAQSATVAATPHDDAPIIGRHGWDLNAPWHAFAVGSAGYAVIRGEEVDRFEVWLGEHSGSEYRGYLRVGDTLAPLPVGSQLNPTSGWFTWAPGVGFVGTYDLVFVRWSGSRAIARQDVRFILAPKGSGHLGVQMVIDTPSSDASVSQPFLLGGWATDLDAVSGTGIDTLHAWAYPSAGGPPVFLGATDYGGPRPDVAAIHGDRFRDSGFGLMVQGLPSGDYDIAVFPWSNVIGGFAPPKIVHVVIP